jgi:trimethylamine--corrinoid protein Co-methyltransferase
MDEEISAISKRIAAGVLVTPETLATDLIKQVGPRGDYMLTEHTISRLRGDEFLAPRVSVRTSRASWEAAGRKDTYQMARDQVRKLSKTAGSPIDPKRAAKLAEIIRSLS